MTHSDMSKRLAIALACLSALFVSACGGGTDSSDDARVDALAAFLQEDYENDNGGLTLTDGQIRCMAGEMVAGLDDDVTDELLAGNAGDDAPPGVGLAIVDATFTCDTMTQMMIDGMVAEGATQEEAECFVNGFDEDILKAMLTSEMTGEDPSPEDEEAMTAALLEVVMTCGVPD
jgi:hypothetical protein